MDNIPVEIEVSARHIHLSKDDYDFLFGEDNNFKIVKNLSQKGEFATDKKVSVIGPDGSVEARYLGPFRKKTQLELSMTDCFEIGISAPYEIEVQENAADVKIAGEFAEITRNCAIIAKRHLHCNPSEAKEHNLAAEDHLDLTIETDRGSIIYSDVVVRIADHYQMRVHLDTDERNAAGISGEMKGILTAKK